MKTIFALQPLEKYIFLAGPTPRNPEVPSWRPEALAILEELGFDGTVLLPESPDWSAHDNYNGQIEWEWQALEMATAIVFWVPRDLARDGNGDLKMPAFTTNVEFGLYARSGKCMFGYPEDAKKMTYLHALARKTRMPVYRDLRKTLDATVERVRPMF